MDSVILTGASGFIGRYCIEHLLAAGYKVHAFYKQQRASSDLPEEEGLSWHRVDLLDPAQVHTSVQALKATHLLHLAWYTEPGKYWDSRLNLDWLRASLYLLKEFAEAGGKRFVGAGTCAEYDWSVSKLNEESTALSPASLYGSCKSSLFQTAQLNAAAAGISFAWGRVFWLYGPGEDKRRIVPYVINALLTEEEANCSDGTQERDYMYVDDVASAFASLLNSEVQGAVNIASGEAVSIRSLVETIARMLDREDLLQLGALPNDNEPPLIVADVSRLQNELNFKPEYSIEEGLRLSLEWWQEYMMRPSTELVR